QAIRRSRRGPRSDKNEDSHHEDFGAQPHGLGTRCLRFVPSIAARGRKTRFPLLATLRDGLGYPQDSDERFRVASYISSPFPRLSWRNVRFSLRTVTVCNSLALFHTVALALLKRQCAKVTDPPVLRP